MSKRRFSKSFLKRADSINKGLTVQASRELRSLGCWMVMVASLLLRQISYLPNPSRAMSYRLSDFGLQNNQSYRLRGDEGRAARHALLASKTFVQYVRVWTLHYIMLAPMKKQAKVWPVILLRSLKIATGLLTSAFSASYFTLKLSYKQVLRPKRCTCLLVLHFNCNYMLAQRCLESWQAWRLSSSTNNGMSPLRQLHKPKQLHAILA